jgi:ribonuclease D
MTDWFKRPLTAEQVRYAAADVVHLLDLRALLEERLAAAGRLEWAYEECERRRRVRQPDVRTVWWKLKGSRQLRGKSRAVAQELAAWRETMAMATDKPARRVMSDEAVIMLAERPPASRKEMPVSRLFDPRRLPSETVADLLAAVARGLELPRGELRLPPDTDLPGPLQPVAALVAAWVGQQSRDLSIDPALIATRGDIEAFLRRVPDNQLQRGWRAQLLGATIEKMVAGKAGIAYDGVGGLVLVDVPGA